ncbi:MAG TPA: hypothetical protein VF192_01245 [Longimicrobiales bacterium]
MARGRGLRVRFSRMEGYTAKGVLSMPLYLPVVVGEFSFEETFEHREFQTHRAGQFSVPAQGPVTARQLRTTDLETLTIDWDWPYLIQYVDPQEARRVLSAIARSRTPFELTATVQWGGPEELRMFATIRSLRRTLKPGEADTRYWQIGISEFRRLTASRRTAGAGLRGRRLPTKHKITNTDTLESLSFDYYGSYSGWAHIGRANGMHKWGASTRLWKHPRWKVGSYIKIPEAPDNIGLSISAAREDARARGQAA